MVMKSKGLLLISVLLSLTCISPLFAENEPHKKGSFQIGFTKRSPISTVAEMKKRKLPEIDPKGDYQIEEMTYAVTVPNDYDPATPMGLFVWISAGDSGKASKGFLEPLAKHGFIYIGADKTGNNFPGSRRFGAAIDAVTNMVALYNIDPSRIYVSGNSGGGRCASQISIAFPEVFTGGAFYVIGCDFWDSLPVPNKPGYTCPGFWPQKDIKLIKQAKDHYFVFLTGSKDFNQPGTIAAYQAYPKDGLKNCLYIEVPDMGHSTPPSEYFEKGLVFLNSPLQEKGKTALKEGMAKVASKKYAEAISLFKKAKGYGIEDAQTQIDALIARAEADTAQGLKLLEEKKVPAARSFFQALIRAYGEDIAKRAKEELAKIENDPAFIGEKKAVELFVLIRNSYATAGKIKTAEALKKLIADYPDTHAAESAKAALKNMGVQ
jgi:hypothetical protein